MEQATFSIPEFCKWAGIGRTHYYNLKNQGAGPPETRIGSRVVISKATAERWLKDQEEPSASEPKTEENYTY
jgi:predicted DNA-binding transcriptional regulator AlpA